MTRKEALTELLEKVVSGKWWNDAGITKAYCAKCGFNDINGNRIHSIMKRGSLDAAKALHEAVLPGWDWAIGCGGVSVYSPEDQRPYDGDFADPARAWLIAILKSLISMED